jgi:hypothetical protein
VCDVAHDQRRIEGDAMRGETRAIVEIGRMDIFHMERFGMPIGDLKTDRV